MPQKRAIGRKAGLSTRHRRFWAHEKASIEGRIGLRLLAQPLYRYQDADAGIVDGAVSPSSTGPIPKGDSSVANGEWSAAGTSASEHAEDLPDQFSAPLGPLTGSMRAGICPTLSQRRTSTQLAFRYHAL